MPLGAAHDETGLLLRERHWLILQRDDGGRWRLDADPAIERYLGRRVRLTGERSGFDRLAVQSIDLA